MREELAKREGLRQVFRATVARWGSKAAFGGPNAPTILLTDVRDRGGETVADHVWFTVDELFARLSLEVGDEIEFTARVIAYRKGCGGWQPRERDYKLAWPSGIKKVTEER